MRKTRLALLAAVSTLIACGTADRSPDQDPLREMKDRPLAENPAAQYTAADLVGRWQFVLTDEVKSKALARIAAKGDAKALEEAKASIDAEAKKEWIEFTANEYRSMVGAEVEHAEAIDSVKVDGSTLTVSQDGKTHEITFRDHDTIVAKDPQKGDLLFTRIQ